MSIRLIHGDARDMTDIPDGSVDLIVTSPPYYGQRSYQDDDGPVDDQIGCEEHPQQYLEHLWTVMRECWRVLKPAGSCFVNLGDKRSGSGAPGTTSQLASGGRVNVERSGMRTYTKHAFGRKKSKMLLPHRFAIGCEDGLADPDGRGWIVRQDQVWEKINGLPESVTDRTRDSHEYWFHLTKEQDYFSGVDEIREPHKDVPAVKSGLGYERTTVGDPSGCDRTENTRGTVRSNHPVGRVPGSVWEITLEPLIIPDDVAAELEIEHFAAFPSEWPRRLILGFSPRDVCTVCGEGRRPITERHVYFDKARDQEHASDIAQRAVDRHASTGGTAASTLNGQTVRTIIGYVCACTPKISNRGARGDWTEGRAESPDHGTAFGAGPGDAVPRRPGGFGDRVPAPETPMLQWDLDGWTPPPSTPAVVLDPFSGTGTTAIVADVLGRDGIGVEKSRAYIRLAEWRATDLTLRSKIRARTNTDLQESLF